MSHEELYEQFKRALLRTKLTDKEIAAGYGISVPTVARWRSGVARPHFAMLPGIIKFLED